MIINQVKTNFIKGFYEPTQLSGWSFVKVQVKQIIIFYYENNELQKHVLEWLEYAWCEIWYQAFSCKNFDKFSLSFDLPKKDSACKKKAKFQIKQIFNQAII